MNLFLRVGIVGALVAAGAVACGSSKTGSGFLPSGGDDDSGVTYNGNDAATFYSTDSGISSFGGDDSSTGTSGNFDAAACAADTQGAKFAPLDLMFMQDTSGSMYETTSGTTTKYQAVTAALTTFMSDTASAGIGMGIQFFPQFADSVPNSCTSNSQCPGSAGPCMIGKFCTGDFDDYFAGASTTAPTNCTSNTQCTNGSGPCGSVQRCSGDPEIPCIDDYICQGYGVGTCNQPDPLGFCVNETLTCAESAYTTAAAPIAPLPGASTAITAALNAHIPNGETPTYSALQGAIAQAKTYAMAHPSDSVVVVLSTDGIPNTNGEAGCNDSVTAIEGIAAAGLAGTPSIKTFVIGTLAPADNTSSATATLNGIAAAGGTTSATILGTSSSTEADLIAALDKIRGASLPCKFTLPVPEAGTPDYGKVNVVYSAASGNLTIGYVETQANCDATAGGWYYDVDPKEGGVPTQVILCAASCTKAQTVGSTSIQVVQGCATQSGIK